MHSGFGQFAFRPSVERLFSTRYEGVCPDSGVSALIQGDFIGQDESALWEHLVKPTSTHFGTGSRTRGQGEFECPGGPDVYADNVTGDSENHVGIGQHQAEWMAVAAATLLVEKGTGPVASYLEDRCGSGRYQSPRSRCMPAGSKAGFARRVGVPCCISTGYDERHRRLNRLPATVGDSHSKV